MAIFVSIYLFTFLICVITFLIHGPNKLCLLDYYVAHWMQKLKSCACGSIFMQKIKWATMDNHICQYVFLIFKLNFHFWSLCQTNFIGSAITSAAECKNWKVVHVCVCDPAKLVFLEQPFPRKKWSNHKAGKCTSSPSYTQSHLHNQTISQYLFFL